MACDFADLVAVARQNGLGAVDEVGFLATKVYLLAQTLKAQDGADYTDICAFANSLKQYDSLPDYIRRGAELANLVAIAVDAGVSELTEAQVRDAINCAHCCGVTVESLKTAEIVLACLLNAQRQPVCWVAREVYGQYDPRWVVFRSWLLGPAPSWLRGAYIRFGERFALWIADKPNVKRVIRFLMDRVV